ncbi:MAG: hypothetical protein CMF25_07195 [Kangiellaceae bacterium]|nr:hypothetical protein [Kangiellaceae bacterium]
MIFGIPFWGWFSVFSFLLAIVAVYFAVRKPKVTLEYETIEQRTSLLNQCSELEVQWEKKQTECRKTKTQIKASRLSPDEQMNLLGFVDRLEHYCSEYADKVNKVYADIINNSKEDTLHYMNDIATLHRVNNKMRNDLATVDDKLNYARQYYT